MENNEHLYHLCRCHKCKREVNISDDANFTCPLCGSDAENVTYISTNGNVDEEIKARWKELHWSTWKTNSDARQKAKRAKLPKCPTCQSTKIRKIGSLERGVSVGTLGVFSNKFNKTFKCENCGYTW